MVCFTKLTPRTPPSVIHGWKATDHLSEMVKWKNYLLSPISRQNFADAFAVNHNLKLEVCRICKEASRCFDFKSHLSRICHLFVAPFMKQNLKISRI